MCLRVKSGPHVAEKDIPVLKVIDTNNQSMHRGFEYEPNKLYERKRIRVTPPDGILEDMHIDAGWHAYRYKGVYYHPRSKVCSWNSDYLKSSPREPRPERVLECLRKGQSKLVAFTIPKGAVYYIGKTGDIVSTQIRSGSLKPMRVRDLDRKRKGAL